jgi:class 3 adenylate cyclase/tetratricopeptide (TPR) repeat protein
VGVRGRNDTSRRPRGSWIVETESAPGPEARWRRPFPRRTLAAVQTCPNCGRESPDDFTFCPNCGQALTLAQGREVRKTVTVVFCDVTGSTAMGERLDPESLRDVQSRYFEAMRAAIERHGGTVEKYIGDAVMAVFGIPQVHEDDALRAVRAAADMREELATLNKELERDRGVTIQVRIGVNTGEVVAGASAGDPALVTGDAVNVAARLEQGAAPGEVLIGEPTHRLVRDAVEAEEASPLEAKGKTDPVRAFRLLGVREVIGAIPRHLDSPMVGRERQLAQLRQMFDAAAATRSCHLCTLLGAAGVGKSRLVDEFLAGVSGDATVVRGRCLPYGDGITYFPAIQAIKEAAGLADFDLPDVVDSKVGAVLEGDQHRVAVGKHITQLMGVGQPAAAEETFWAIRRFFEASARERALVLVFDDIHWGEPTFLDLIEHIADWSRGSPILLLCMARPELLDVRSGWGGGKLNAATVSLEPLSAVQAGQLIANLLGSAELPAEVAERIVETAEGNPLFVEETLGMLIDDGRVVRRDGRWVVAGDLSSVTVPPSIQALLASRLDRLTPDERETLEAAAVVGKDFFTGAVRDLLGPEARSRVSSDLMALVRKELIRPDRSTLPGEDAFRFRHLLIRDAAYDAMPKAQRAELHERFADWLERVAGGAVSEQDDIVGYHLEQAHGYLLQLGPVDERAEAIGRRASGHLAAAGRRGSLRSDHPAGANLLRRALALAPDRGEDRARILYDLGIALLNIGDARPATAAFDEAVENAADAGDRSLELLARIRLSSSTMMSDPHGQSTEAFRVQLEEAARHFGELGDDAALATVWTELAEVEWMPCLYERAERAVRRAVEHARRSGDLRLLEHAGAVLLAATMFGPASSEEGLRTIDELAGDAALSRHLEEFALVARAYFVGMRGEFDESRRLLRLADEIATSLGLRFDVGANREQQGTLERYAGDPVASERACRESYVILDELGDEGHKSTGAANLAVALCALGRFDEAEPYAEEALRIAAEDDTASQAPGRSALALVRAARGEHEEAERLAREAAELYANAESPNFQADVWLDLARVLRTVGKRGEAGEAAREALALYERKGNEPAAAITRAFIDELA